MTDTASSRNNVISSMRYQRPLEAIDWLCRVFGFEQHAVYKDPDGAVQHAHLNLGGGMVMLGPVSNTPFSPYIVQPSEVGNRETTSIYLVIDNVRPVYEKAKSAGVEILLDLRTESYGGEHFTCRDPEGHIWSIGSYDPWKKE